MPQQRIEFEGTIHEFPADFTDADIAAALGSGGGGESQPTTGPTRIPALGTAAGVAAGIAAKSLPAIVGGINTAAKAAGNVARGRAARMVPAVVGVDAAGDVLSGRPRQAAEKVAGAGVVSQLPRVARAIERATAPGRSTVVRNAVGRFAALPTPPGIVTRGASALSKWAGALAALGIAWDAAEGIQALHEKLIAKANHPQTPPDVRNAVVRMLSGGGLGIDYSGSK